MAMKTNLCAVLQKCNSGCSVVLKCFLKKHNILIGQVNTKFVAFLTDKPKTKEQFIQKECFFSFESLLLLFNKRKVLPIRLIDGIIARLLDY